jgi:hypothetical protein
MCGIEKDTRGKGVGEGNKHERNHFIRQVSGGRIGTERECDIAVRGGTLILSEEIYVQTCAGESFNRCRSAV